MRIFRYLVFLIFLPVSSHALTHRDFSRGFPLELEPLSPLQCFELNYEIYEAGFRQDLGDMRIFNGNGHVMPMHLRTVPRERMQPEQKKKTTTLLLPVFRLESSDEVGRRINDYRMLVNTSNSGTLISVERTEKKGQEKNPTLLLDATFTDEPLNALSFHLKKPMDSLLSLVIEGSDDLTSWNLVGVETLARMEHENGHILRDTVPIYGKKWKYYRVQGEGDFSAVGKIYGAFGAALFPEEETWRWHTLEGKKVEKGVYEYRLPRGLQASVLDLVNDDNTILDITLLVPADEKDWREIGRASFYRIHLDGKHIRNVPLVLQKPMERFRIRMKGAPAPLRVGWHPQEIVFMPQDMPPFLLAVGNPEVTRENLLAPMLGNLAGLKIGEAIVGKAQVLGGDKRLQTEGRKDRIDLGKLVLWGILGLGVLLLAGMASYLVRGMKKAGEKDLSEHDGKEKPENPKAP